MGLRKLAGATAICAVETLDLFIEKAMSERPPRNLRGLGQKLPSEQEEERGRQRPARTTNIW
jgi:hypothetical protein